MRLGLTPIGENFNYKKAQTTYFSCHTNQDACHDMGKSLMHCFIHHTLLKP